MSAQTQGGREAEILDMLKAMSPDELRCLARKLDRSTMTPSVLSWVSAQRSLDLGTALTMFIHAEPAEFNHLEKEDVPEAQRRLCAALDALCQRINCGYYLPAGEHPLDDVAPVAAWMKAQDEDDRSRRKGRWRFTPAVVAPMTSDIRRIVEPRKTAARTERPGLFRRAFNQQSA
ncbi:hypothetical protein [Pseudooceanicola sp. LIPI14-2-Ac024]|uniref:hypothetical protein n=1 Tax=Pseudooceanicola sp. LIPI14-2-Ac024 TaxID=3344875 RepID=UPI0035CE9A27